MRRIPTRSLDDLMGRMLREDGLETPLLQHRALELIKTLLGPSSMDYVENVWLSGQTAYVKVSSAPLRQNLSMIRSGMLRRINEQYPNIITDIRFV